MISRARVRAHARKEVSVRGVPRGPAVGVVARLSKCPLDFLARCHPGARSRLPRLSTLFKKITRSKVESGQGRNPWRTGSVKAA
jgi:hypothetical protein